ncbi:MAG: Spx/MgsR family transcriptional regulator [Alphaproteobacteria bacterium]|jgi:arsenate reductase
MITVFGIPNCDTCRKARKWLKDQKIDHGFHDFRKDGLTRADVDGWVDAVGWETLLNRRGTTWRKLPEADKVVSDAASAAALMTENPTLIKRPVIAAGETILVGFKADVQTALESLAK